jgi:hypothetical protein
LISRATASRTSPISSAISIPSPASTCSIRCQLASQRWVEAVGSAARSCWATLIERSVGLNRFTATLNSGPDPRSRLKFEMRLESSELRWPRSGADPRGPRQRRRLPGKAYPDDTCDRDQPAMRAGSIGSRRRSRRDVVAFARDRSWDHEAIRPRHRRRTR